MKVQDYTTDPTLVAVLNWCSPGEMDPETGMGTYYLGDSIVTARPLWRMAGAVPGEWYIESVGGY